VTKTAIAPRISTASPIAALLTTDGYKQSHYVLFPQAGTEDGDGTGTTRVTINWTNRSNKYMPESSHAVVFGLQAFAQRYLTEAWASFFAADEDEVARLFDEALLGYFGPQQVITSDHVRELHSLGYLPIRIKALPEGTLAPIGVATLTIENTVDSAYWLPNYIETALSASIWHPGTTATTAVAYRDLLEKWSDITGTDGSEIDFQAHDFSMRGQTSIESASASGAGHLLSFLGTDSMPSLDFISRYYPGDNGWVAASVPATEHSVMCIRGEAGELATFSQILDTFKNGIVSAVSDGYDYWNVLTVTLPVLKKRIMARDGKLVIRPDSGDPVEIMAGTYNVLAEGNSIEDYEAKKADGLLTPEELGSIEVLDQTFGHTVNEKGFKVLDSHIGLIYGDSITLKRAGDTLEQLAAKGWASNSVVFGIGSFTYQMVSRDSLGSAVKATHGIVDGISTDIQKDPKTGGAGKKSAKGRIALHRDENGEIYQLDERTEEQADEGLLQVVWENGAFYVHQSFADVRATLKTERAARKARLALAA
jgi:nicotinamide phosphoribosyltransferase